LGEQASAHAMRSGMREQQPKWAFDTESFAPQRSLPQLTHDADATRRSSRRRGTGSLAHSRSVEFRTRSSSSHMRNARSSWGGGDDERRASHNSSQQLAPMSRDAASRRFPALTQVQWENSQYAAAQPRRGGSRGYGGGGGVPADSFRRHTAILESDGTLEGQPWAPPSVSEAPAQRLAQRMQLHSPTMEHFANNQAQAQGDDVFGNPSMWTHDMHEDHMLQEEHAELLRAAELQGRAFQDSQSAHSGGALPRGQGGSIFVGAEDYSLQPTSWGRPMQDDTLRPVRRKRGSFNVTEHEVGRQPMRSYFEEQVAMSEQMMALRPRSLEQRVMATLQRALVPEVAQFYRPRTPEGKPVAADVDYDDGSATTIQSMWRGKQQREKAEKQRRAMRFWSGHALSTSFHKLDSWRLRVRDLRLSSMRRMRFGALANVFDRWMMTLAANEAARVMQRGFRGYYARNDARMQNDASSSIQRQFRARQQRKKYLAQRRAMRYWKGKSLGLAFDSWQCSVQENNASKIMQSMWRGKQEREGYKKSRSAVRFWLGKAKGAAFDRWATWTRKVCALRIKTLMRMANAALAYCFDRWAHEAADLRYTRETAVQGALEDLVNGAMAHDPTERYLAAVQQRFATSGGGTELEAPVLQRLGLHHSSNTLRDAPLDAERNTLGPPTATTFANGGAADPHAGGMQLSEAVPGVLTPLPPPPGADKKGWFGGKKGGAQQRLLPAVHVHLFATAAAPLEGQGDKPSCCVTLDVLRTMNIDGAPPGATLQCSMELQGSTNPHSAGASHETLAPRVLGSCVVYSVAQQGSAGDADERAAATAVDEQLRKERMAREMGFDAKSAKTALEKYGRDIEAAAQEVVWRQRDGSERPPAQAACDAVFLLQQHELRRTRVKCCVSLASCPGDVLGVFYVGMRTLAKQLFDEQPAAAGASSHKRLDARHGSAVRSARGDAWLLLRDAPTTLHVKVAPLPAMYKVAVDVLACTNLPRGDGDFPDPYCRLELLPVGQGVGQGDAGSQARKPKKGVKGAKASAAQRAFKTAHVDNTLSPEWDESFTFSGVRTDTEASDEEAGYKLHFSVFDKDLLSADDTICDFELPLSDLKQEGGAVCHELWLECEPGRGEEEGGQEEQLELSRAAVRQAFDSIDTDGNGLLERAEVLNVSRALLDEAQDGDEDEEARAQREEALDDSAARTMQTRTEMDFAEFYTWWCRNSRLEASRKDSGGGGLFGALKSRFKS